MLHLLFWLILWIQYWLFYIIVCKFIVPSDYCLTWPIFRNTINALDPIFNHKILLVFLSFSCLYSSIYYLINFLPNYPKLLLTVYFVSNCLIKFCLILPQVVLLAPLHFTSIYVQSTHMLYSYRPLHHTTNTVYIHCECKLQNGLKNCIFNNLFSLIRHLYYLHACV